ncbi:methionyl-tRNA formyltransferase [Haliea sp. E17]|uniref:methionyl-tRNA formyltransferase n=1 Tax=Haliea sp. E17 TaxID=3401576 RepID=UPI003AAFA032
MAAMRVVFAGTPAFAAQYLKAIIDSEHQLIGVYTQPDRPAGRGKKLQASPVKQVALEAGLPVYQPQSLRDAGAQAQFASLQADVLVVVAYGLILPQPVLDAPRYGCINVHASLLPRWRGAAPIQRAIEAGDASSGVTIMQMDAGLDTGAMLARRDIPLSAQTTAASLEAELADVGPPLLLEVLGDLPGHQARAEVQDETATCYAAKISKEEAQLDWTQSAEQLGRQVRAFNPAPVCFSHLDGQRIKVWEGRVAGNAPLPEPPGSILQVSREGILVNTGSGQLLLTRLQLPGGKPLDAAQILNGSGDLLRRGAQFTRAADPA